MTLLSLNLNFLPELHRLTKHGLYAGLPVQKKVQVRLQLQGEGYVSHGKGLTRDSEGDLLRGPRGRRGGPSGLGQDLAEA